MNKKEIKNKLNNVVLQNHDIKINDTALIVKSRISEIEEIYKYTDIIKLEVSRVSKDDTIMSIWFMEEGEMYKRGYFVINTKPFTIL